MKIIIDTEFGATEVLAITLYEDDNLQPLGDLEQEVSAVIKEKRFSPKFGEIYSTNLSPYKKVLVVGLGKKEEMNLEKVRKICGKLVCLTKKDKLTSLTTDLADKVDADPELLGRALAEGLVLANYSFIKYFNKEKQDKKKPVTTVSLKWAKNKTKIGSGLKIGKVISESANFVRDLVNEPANIVNSQYLEKVARSVAASSSKIRLRVLNKEEMKKLGMGALLGVNAGSAKPPKLIILEYRGAKGKPIALVGKGITFDTGGYNLKPTKYIEEMHTDMAGSAAVLGTIKAAAKLGIKKNLLGVMAVCENMVSALAQHPGDIVKAYNGLTVQIGNTDAEGRLVLADALSYVEKKYQPEIIIDLATLTGACVVALGYYAAAIITKDNDLAAELQVAGQASGDRLWQLPFFDEYQDWMDGSVSDLNNISQKGKGYEGGSITAGVFLSKFVEKARWAHLDIAGSAFWSVNGDYLKKGATGSGVRALTYYLLK